MIVWYSLRWRAPGTAAWRKTLFSLKEERASAAREMIMKGYRIELEEPQVVADQIATSVHACN